MSISNILIYLALLLAVLNSLVLLGLWRALKNTRSRLGQVGASTQRLEREVAQQRYAIAMLRQLQNDMQDPPPEEKTDEELLNNAVRLLEELAGPEEKAAPAKPISQATLKAMKDEDTLHFIKKAIRENTLSIHQQPIVTLPARETKYYEVFARIMVDNTYIPAKNFVSVAKSHNLIGAVDNVLLLRCLQLLKQNQKEQNAELFINISAQTLINKTYMKDLVDFLAANPKLSSRLIFEMPQEESLKLPAAAKNVMEGLSLLGCRFSMDQITILGMDVNRLIDQNISFVKLDAAAMEREIENVSNRKRLKKIKTVLDSQGITVILEKVENEKQLFTLLDLHADYGQGYLFGAPVSM